MVVCLVRKSSGTIRSFFVFFINRDEGGAVRYFLSLVLLLNLLGAAPALADNDSFLFALDAGEQALLIEQGATLEYQKDIQPIFNRRCVVCHSCYNSPCQLKMTSWEGVARGATKEQVYNPKRLRAAEPTRLFVDAKNARQWQKDKGFTSMLPTHDSLGSNSFMFQLLALKEKQPAVRGYYDSESSDLTCSQEAKELRDFMTTNPHKGMPFGFPELKKEELQTLKAWLVAGGKGPSDQKMTELKTPGGGAQGLAVLKKWDVFLNGQDSKTVTMARYLYEHLFLAHIYFAEIPGDYYYLVRSRTPWPQEIDEIPSRKPYDNPGAPFYYRFRKIHCSIVHKTHILYGLSAAKMARYQELFLDVAWQGTVVSPVYESEMGSNPFLTFQQIPARSRYQFLLDDAHYFVMSFIRGPVCKGQVALNVINDHFWITFLHPDADLFVTDGQFRTRNIDNLRLPVEAAGLWHSFFYIPSLKGRDRFVADRAATYALKRPDGLGLSDIWPGDHSGSTPLLTVYRHFDSASVVAGPIGGLPRMAWVLDYPNFERMYYNLVAGFDVYSKAQEQVSIRLYMDLQRREAEHLFLNFMPDDRRRALRKGWYKSFWAEAKVNDDDALLMEGVPTRVPFKSSDVMGEFFDLVLHKRFAGTVPVAYDAINYHPADIDRTLSHSITSEADLDREFRKISHWSGPFVQAIPDQGDMAQVRFRRDNGEDLVYTMILNRYHSSVAFITGDKRRLDKTKDTIHVVKGFLGSYPNVYFDVPFRQAPRFFRRLTSSHSRQGGFMKFFNAFGVRRSDPRLWELADFFDERFRSDFPLQAGIFDLNRYLNDRRLERQNMGVDWYGEEEKTAGREKPPR